jgi:hypothetical protein
VDFSRLAKSITAWHRYHYYAVLFKIRLSEHFAGFRLNLFELAQKIEPFWCGQR